MRTERRITLDGFLKAFRRQDRNQPDHPFCFILGAGASKPSGIRTGGELALHIVDEIYQAENFRGESLENWCAADGLRIKNFQLGAVAEFYPELYQRMFGEHPDQGYAFLEKEMEDREPSYGYSVLAWILANTPHKVVVTPNFDNLVADALSIHSATFPRVVGHDSLAGFVQAALRRPLIAKVHGDLGFTPRNTPDEIARLSEEWKTALTRVLERFTPIVIGYGGNDGSLMAALEGLPKGMPESIYWCEREGDPASGRVMRLLEEKKGRLVGIPGFDELMLKLQDVMLREWKMPDLLVEMKNRQRQRENSYDKQRSEIGARLAAPPDTARAVAHVTGAEESRQEARDLAGAAVRVLASTQSQKPWWQWSQEAASEPDLNKRKSIYRAGLEALPNSAGLLGNYAVFLTTTETNQDHTEEIYKRAIAADPVSANNLGNYAIFLDDYLKEPDRAEEFYLRAIKADPRHANNLRNYAVFLETERKDLDRAQEQYKQAVEADPKRPDTLLAYAIFLEVRRKDLDEAERFFQLAVIAAPNDADVLGAYANFLKNAGKDANRVAAMYERAIQADPKNASNFANYGLFQEFVRKDLDRADQLYQQAIQVDQRNAHALGNYASFLARERSDWNRAEQFYERAMAADASDAVTLGNYAGLLLSLDKKINGLAMLKRAEAAQHAKPDLSVELLFYRLAHDPTAWPEQLGKLNSLLRSGYRSPGWPFTQNIQRAEKDRHSNPALLRALAKVINDEAPIETLYAFPEWRSAEGRSA